VNWNAVTHRRGGSGDAEGETDEGLGRRDGILRKGMKNEGCVISIKL
jgi:hypothetical protein